MGRQGSFEVSLNGQVIYSRLDTGQFPDNEQVAATVRKMVGGGEVAKTKKVHKAKCSQH